MVNEDQNIHKEEYVNTYDVRGIVLRHKKGYSYYFNNEGIYSKTRGFKDDRIPYFVYLQSRGNYTNSRLSTNFSLVRKIISKLELGDSISDLYELARVVELEKIDKPKGIDRFMTVSIRSKDFERNKGNNNLKTFDRIRIICGILSSPDFFKELNDAEINEKKTIHEKQRAYIEKNYFPILEKVLDRLQSSRSFKKYGIPINFLKLADFTLRTDSSIQILFELKGLGKDDQNNSDNYDSKRLSHGRG